MVQTDRWRDRSGDPVLMDLSEDLDQPLWQFHNRRLFPLLTLAMHLSSEPDRLREPLPPNSPCLSLSDRGWPGKPY